MNDLSLDRQENNEDSGRKFEGMFLRHRRMFLSYLTNNKDEDDDKDPLLSEKVAYLESRYTFEKMKEAIWPLLTKLVGEGEDFQKTSVDLMYHYLRISYEEIFYSDVIPDKSHTADSLSVGGEFEYFFKKYGEPIALAVMAYQTHSFPNVKTCEEIESVFAFTLDMPEEWRKDIAIACNGYHPEVAQMYLDAVPKIIEYFTEQGRPELIDYYLRYCAVPRMNEKGESKFPVCDLAAAFKEMEALYDYGELRDNVMGFANFIFMNSRVESTFLKNEDQPEKSPTLPIYYLVNEMKTQYGDDEKVKEILKIPFTHPELGPEAVFVVTYYKNIDDNFPGGVPEFIKLIAEIRSFIYTSGKAGHNFFMMLTMHVKSAPKNNLEKFWTLGKRVMKYLREDSTPYLNTKGYSPALKELLENDFDAFEKIVVEGMNVAFQMSVAMPDRTGDSDSQIFKAYLKFYGDPKFDDFLEGLKILIHESSFYVDRVKEKTKSSDMVEKLDLVTSMYLNVWAVKKDKDSPAHLGDHDFVKYALSMKLAGFENVVLIDDETMKKYREDGVNMMNNDCLYADKFSAEKIEQLVKVLSNSHDYRRSNTAQNEAQLGRALEDFENELIDPPVGVQIAIERVREDVKATIGLNYWRNVLGFDEHGKGLKAEGDAEISSDSWIYSANPSTQLAASSGALFLALGLGGTCGDLPELELAMPDGVLTPLFFKGELEALGRGEIKLPELLEILRSKNQEKNLRANIQKALPYVVRAIIAARLAYPGLMAIGTKVESCKDLSFKDFRFVLDLAGLGDIRTTPFQLKHSGRSLVNPPLPSALEEKLLTYFHAIFGLINPADIDIQVTMGGRMGNEIAGVVCASNILASDVSVQYADGAFSAGLYDGATDSRIMVYDAGVRSRNLPFDLSQAEGRTDRVGCKSMTDIFLLQVLGTFGVHHQFDGSFKAQMEEYKLGFEAILESHGLRDCLSETAWVFEVLQPWDAIEFHEAMLRKFSVARRDNEGLKNEVRGLMADKLLGYLRRNRERICAESPEDFELLKTY